MFDSRDDVAPGPSPARSRPTAPPVAPLSAAKAIRGAGRVAASAVTPAAVRTVRRPMLRMRTPSLLRYRPHGLMGGFATGYATYRTHPRAARSRVRRRAPRDLATRLGRRGSGGRAAP